MTLAKNLFKARLAKPETQIGLWMALAHPGAAEICAGAGFDWLVIDAEHGPNGLAEIMAQLRVLESQDPDRDIIMYINSPGGSFTAMTAIYDTMQYVSPQIQTVVLGQAASAAAVLLAAGAPGKRLALPNARILIHQPAMGEAGHGQASDIEIQAAEILRMRTWLEETLAKHSHRSADEVNRDIDRDKILSAEEAVTYGLVDQVLTTRKRVPATPAK